jgi:hypothetical protein
MEFLAAGSDALNENPSDSSFLQKASDLLGNAQVKLTWGDDASQTKRLLSSDWYEIESAEPQVRYLSQQFVERLCSSAGLATELRQEMERVVFDAREQGDRMQCDTFDELANVLLTPIAEKREELQQSIRAIGDEVLKEDHLREQLPEQVKSIKLQKEAVEKIQRELKDLLPKDNEAHTLRLRQLETICTTTEGNVEELRLRRKILQDLGADVQQTIQSREPTRFQDLHRRFSGASLSAEEWKAFRMAFVGDPAAILQNAVLKLDGTIERITNGEAGKPPVAADAALELMSLTQLRTLRDAARKAVGIDVDRQKKYQELQRALTQTEGALRRLETEHVHATGATERRAELIKRRKLEYVEVMKTLAQEETILAELYSPLRDRLKESEGTLAKLAFVVEREVKLADWVKQGEDLIDLRKDSRFRGHGALQKHAEERLLKNWKSGSPEDIANAIEGFIEEFTGDLMSALPEFTDDRQKGIRKQQIGAWLYDATHIKVQYGITYEGTPIERLSPGTRGIVLLLLYLAVDIHDRRPLFIDQPEENLDPYSVFTELVPHFWSAKKRRQIIMVTHNANLVVNTDADQIVVATSARTEGGGLPQITYRSGSIENPTIRRSVCRLLEGGRRAFLEREGRYRIYTDDVIEGAEGDD